jgi:hypothetical protein
MRLAQRFLLPHVTHTFTSQTWPAHGPLPHAQRAADFASPCYDGLHSTSISRTIAKPVAAPQDRYGMSWVNVALMRGAHCGPADGASRERHEARSTMVSQSALHRTRACARWRVCACTRPLISPLRRPRRTSQDRGQGHELRSAKPLAVAEGASELVARVVLPREPGAASRAQGGALRVGKPALCDVDHLRAPRAGADGRQACRQGNDERKRCAAAHTTQRRPRCEAQTRT